MGFFLLTGKKETPLERKDSSAALDMLETVATNQPNRKPAKQGTRKTAEGNLVLFESFSHNPLRWLQGWMSPRSRPESGGGGNGFLCSCHFFHIKYLDLDTPTMNAISKLLLFNDPRRLKKNTLVYVKPTAVELSF